MKKIKLSNKLNLNKKTISILDDDIMALVNGGDDNGKNSCDVCDECYTYEIECVSWHFVHGFSCRGGCDIC